MPEYTMLILWIALLIAFIVVEAATVQLVTIWFAVGAAAALISELCSAPVWLQWVIFADRYIGLEGIVEETVDNTEGTGIVKVEGSTWTARSSDGSRIEKGSNITVDRIDGVKLMVSKH